MEHSSSEEEETDISDCDSDIEEYAEKSYEQLQAKKHIVKLSNGIIRCPFCPGKKKQAFKHKDLLQHAIGISKGSSKRGPKEKANHIALAKYLETDLVAPADNDALQLGIQLNRLSVA